MRRIGLAERALLVLLLSALMLMLAYRAHEWTRPLAKKLVGAKMATEATGRQFRGRGR